MKTEGPERDPTWVQSLPSEAQRCFCKHALEIASGLYDPEIIWVRSLQLLRTHIA